MQDSKYSETCASTRPTWTSCACTWTKRCSPRRFIVYCFLTLSSCWPRSRCFTGSPSRICVMCARGSLMWAAVSVSWAPTTTTTNHSSVCWLEWLRARCYRSSSPQRIAEWARVLVYIIASQIYFLSYTDESASVAERRCKENHFLLYGGARWGFSLLLNINVLLKQLTVSLKYKLPSGFVFIVVLIGGMVFEAVKGLEVFLF